MVQATFDWPSLGQATPGDPVVVDPHRMSQVSDHFYSYLYPAFGTTNVLAQLHKRLSGSQRSAVRVVS
ncbi:unnamed protein product [Clonostachys rosea f. rosea IK726]|uniref:Uncharacterized protein n=1 Tax=Clonostachys rosea f. rosea IK726 TaxID=1349383 RepID=A0ACA9TCD7_BIOOC|nr:unnamed protein product [Clonostachys rosea f. rosea IK726]